MNLKNILLRIDLWADQIYVLVHICYKNILGHYSYLFINILVQKIKNN